MFRKIIRFGFVFIITALLGILALWVPLNAITQIPNIRIQNRVESKSGLTVKEIADFLDEKVLSEVAFSADGEETEVKGRSVVPTAVNEDYFALQKFNLNGKNFTESDITDKSTKAIISETLARKLFFNKNAVGKTFEMNSKVYTVCAVFKEYEDIISRCSADGKDRVFIPYTGMDYAKLTVDTVMYSNTNDNIKITLLCSEDYSGTNLIQKNKVLQNFINILKAEAFILLATVVIKIIILLTRQVKQLFKKEIKNRYFAEIIGNHKLYIFSRVLAVIAAAALLAVAFIVSDFEIYVLPYYMAEDNIFGIPHYISKIIEASQNGNSILIAGDTYYNNLYTLSFVISLFSAVLFAVMIIVMYKQILCALKKLRKTGQK